MPAAEHATVDTGQEGEAIVDALDEHLVVPDPVRAPLVEEIADYLPEDASDWVDDEKTLRAADEIYETIITPAIRALAPRDEAARPVRDGQSDGDQREAFDEFWIALAEQLDAAYGTSLMDDPLTETPDGWDFDQESAVDADLPAPDGMLHERIAARTEATAPCPRCGEAEMAFDRIGWKAHDRFTHRGWLLIYHDCPACDAKAQAAWKTGLGTLPTNILNAIEVWYAGAFPGSYVNTLHKIRRRGSVRAYILDPSGSNGA